MTSHGRVQFELHDLRDVASDPLHAVFPQHSESEVGTCVLAIANDEPTWVGIADDTRLPIRVPDVDTAAFGVQIVQRKLSRELALVPVCAGVLVNSIPALSLTLLGTRDSISVGPGHLLFLTQRVRPHIGPPTEEMLSARWKCPFCKLTVASDTVVVSCRCGTAVYHHETEESHPQLPSDDRLNCQSKISTCLACGQLVSLEESLVWDPATL